MATFTKIPTGRVLFIDNSGQYHGFSDKSSILPDPRDENSIVIASIDSSQTGDIRGHRVDWRNVTDPVSTSRNNLIDILNQYYFTSQVNIASNGKNAGTLFGDNIISASRYAVGSGKYSQGLPVHAVNYKIVGSGYWQVVNDGTPNGASEFGTGTDANGKIYLSSKGLNRYYEGYLSYYLFTALWQGIQSANGDFIALVGASLPGLAVDGQDGDIKEGFMFGWKRVSGVLTSIVRKVKGFTPLDYTCEGDVDQCENLQIFDMNVGYLGIHPFLLYRVNFDTMIQDLVKKIKFEQDTTSVNDPNMAISVYLENITNTTNIFVRNGSFNYGNIQSVGRTSDPSARELADNYTNASIPSGTDTVLRIYTVPDKVTMHSRLDSGGTTQSEFRNTIRNKLKKIIAVAESGSVKPISVSIYLIPIADVSGANFQPINPYVNVLYSSDIGTVSLANAIKIVELGDIRQGAKDDVRLEDYLLDGSLAGVITVSSAGTINNMRYTIITEDQF